MESIPTELQRAVREDAPSLVFPAGDATLSASLSQSMVTSPEFIYLAADHGAAALLSAIFKQYPTTSPNILRPSAPLNAPVSYDAKACSVHDSLLTIAARLNSEPLVAALLASHADPNATRSLLLGGTPPLTAALALLPASEPVLKLLLGAGADPAPPVLFPSFLSPLAAAARVPMTGAGYEALARYLCCTFATYSLASPRLMTLLRSEIREALDQTTTKRLETLEAPKKSVITEKKRNKKKAMSSSGGPFGFLGFGSSGANTKDNEDSTIDDENQVRLRFLLLALYAPEKMSQRLSVSRHFVVSTYFEILCL